ncbi:primosomal protein N' [Fulvivirgaceae bacterium BMA12]|uniref:Replication restart protein PriA n=1 Tax=Agaribacillus aureus TaxID=3051825 RepID=A0ABT8L8J1_9BACT|nr:primosomal protein N' [Fulvivirgaceae bacterium BMA12]
MAQLELNNEGTSERKTFFASILLPVPIPKAFTYRIPKALESSVVVGSRVIVQFGRKKILTGIVADRHETPPEAYEAKYILEVLDGYPVMTSLQIKLLYWVAEYYMCTIGEVLNAALPSGLKLSSQSSIQLHPDFDAESGDHQFSEKEELILNALKHRITLTYDEVTAVLQQKSIYPILKSLLTKDAILIFEKVKEKFKPKKIGKVRLAQSFIEDNSLLEGLFEKLEKKPRQLEVLLKYLQEVPVYHHPEKNIAGLNKKSLIAANLSPSSLKTMVKNGVFETFDEIVSRFDHNNTDTAPIPAEFSPAQNQAMGELMEVFTKKDIALLHGITGSGKTEIYINLITKNLENGNQVLYLLPEIALTTQIVKRLMKVFGSQMGVFHSKYSDNERVEVWNGVLSGKFSFVVGVRSSVFLPFDNLGLIIVDEEHDNSYKQFDPAPRYHARDVAMVLAGFHHAKVLLGSATPSLESYYLASQDKYGLVKLDQRFGGGKLPAFKLINVLKERKKKTMREDFSPQLLEAIKQALQSQEQVIIFQNRRGYAPYITCEECNWIPKCESCAVSLTYHMYINQLRCHYCGHQEKPVAACPACGSTKLKTMGFGTEKLEEDLKSFFPEATIRRMDLDTTRSKYSYQNIIDDFEKGDTDILVGTQMLSKGLDFGGVNMVGILDADRMINFPDFRSTEKTFQLITQVSGRAGRRNKTGEVYIQTSQIDHPLFQKITGHQYLQMYKDELVEREKYKYPPFVRLIKITLKHPQKPICHKASRYLHNLLKSNLGASRILGPNEPLISKIRNLYLMEIMVKIERSKVNLKNAKKALRDCITAIETDRQFKGIRIIVDVDSY